MSREPLKEIEDHGYIIRLYCFHECPKPYEIWVYAEGEDLICIGLGRTEQEAVADAKMRLRTTEEKLAELL